MKEHNYYGQLRIPVLNISLEQLILILYPTFLIPAVFFWYTHQQKRKVTALSPPGCTHLRLKGESHMVDEYESKYDEGSKDASEWSIKAIHIHPIKSCAPVELDEADIDAAGMKWDRKFAFAELFSEQSSGDAMESTQESKWKFRTQRTPGFERLALVRPEVWLPDHTASKQSLRISRTGALVIKYPNVPTGFLAFLDRWLIKHGLLPSESSFRVPLIPLEDHKYPSETVNIWHDNPVWLNYSVHVPDDFKQFIGGKRPLGLFRVDETCLREVFRNAPRKAELGYQPAVGFADAYPLHLLNLASVHDIGNRVKESIPRFSAKRFRSNMLVNGPKAFDEDDWKVIRVTSKLSGGEVDEKKFHCACHTVRCRLPNVDPETAIRHSVEPDKTLKGFRCIDEGDPKNACLGLQLVPAGVETQSIKVRVGDKIEVLERGEHLYQPSNTNPEG